MDKHYTFRLACRISRNGTGITYLEAIEIRLYDEMNRKIVDILRIDESNTADLYAAELIEALTKQLEAANKQLAKHKARKIVVAGEDNEVLAVIMSDKVVEKNGVSVMIDADWYLNQAENEVEE